MTNEFVITGQGLAEAAGRVATSPGYKLQNGGDAAVRFGLRNLKAGYRLITKSPVSGIFLKA